MNTMTTAEKLQRIKAKCEELLARYKNERAYMPEGERELAQLRTAPAEAGWRATIALVEHILNGWLTDESGCDIITQNILAAWEGLV